MNRRKFLGTLFGAGAALAAAPLLALVPAAPKPISIEFASSTLLMDATLLHDRYIVPAAQALAAEIDRQMATWYRAAVAREVSTNELAAGRAA